MSRAPKVGSSTYKALSRTGVLVLTGAGASVPLGMPAMDRFSDLLTQQGGELLAQFIPPTGKSAWNDLEELLERLTFYEEVKNRYATDRNMQLWVGFQNQRQTGALAERLKSQIFEAIIRRLGILDDAAIAKAVSIYPSLYESLLKAAGNRPPVLPIFTTNYDLTFEALRDRNPRSFKICTGIKSIAETSEWHQENYQTQNRYEFAIFRLHGCSHWMKERSTGRIYYQQIPDTSNPDTREPCVLYPIPGKEDRIYEQPFRCAYWHFEKLLMTAKTIVIIGYSGRDPVIQSHLLESLEHDRSKRIAIVTGGDTLREELKTFKGRCAEFKHFSGGIEKNKDDLAKWA